MCASLLLASFTSCEMKDELWGKEDNATAGQLQLALTNNAPVSEVSRAESTDNGLKPGVFDKAEVDVTNYTLEITDQASGQLAKQGKVADMGVNNGNVSVSLEEGTYVAKAFNYDGSGVSVSTRPYFMGEKEFQILPGKTTNAPVECKLQNMEVAVSLAQSFIESFKDDYTITVDNGAGAIQVFTKDNISTKYYYAVPDGKEAIKVSVKATTKATEFAGEQNIMRTYTVTKPADAEGNTTLAKGDAFIINLKEDNSTLSYIDFAMSVDFSFADQEEVITIPTENIVYNENGGDNPNPPATDPITFEGLPAEYENPGDKGEQVVVTINASKGIQNLYVNIKSDNESFTSTLAGFGLDKEFDLANPGDLEYILTHSLDSGEGIGLLKPGEVITGKTSYVFDVTEFMGLLGLYGNSVNTFSIRVVDAASNEKAGDLKVTISGK